VNVKNNNNIMHGSETHTIFLSSEDVFKERNTSGLRVLI